MTLSCDGPKRGVISALRKEANEASVARKAECLSAAEQVLAGKLYIAAAARRAKCSTRAMYRWISEAKRRRNV